MGESDPEFQRGKKEEDGNKDSDGETQSKTLV